jgi:hypothetical protein
MRPEIRSSTKRLDPDINGSTTVLGRDEAIVITLRRAHILLFVLVVIAVHIVVLHATGNGFRPY